jgi:hypothetical protein
MCIEWSLVWLDVDSCGDSTVETECWTNRSGEHLRQSSASGDSDYLRQLASQSALWRDIELKEGMRVEHCLWENAPVGKYRFSIVTGRRSGHRGPAVTPFEVRLCVDGIRSRLRFGDTRGIGSQQVLATGRHRLAYMHSAGCADTVLTVGCAWAGVRNRSEQLRPVGLVEDRGPVVALAHHGHPGQP